MGSFYGHLMQKLSKKIWFFMPFYCYFIQKNEFFWLFIEKILTFLDFWKKCLDKCEQKMSKNAFFWLFIRKNTNFLEKCIFLYEITVKWHKNSYFFNQFLYQMLVERAHINLYFFTFYGHLVGLGFVIPWGGDPRDFFCKKRTVLSVFLSKKYRFLWFTTVISYKNWKKNAFFAYFSTPFLKFFWDFFWSKISNISIWNCVKLWPEISSKKKKKCCIFCQKIFKGFCKILIKESLSFKAGNVFKKKFSYFLFILSR